MRAARNVAFVTCAATLALIAVGVYVRTTGSGLGCPDWPTCHGGFVPPGDRHAIIEFSHRFVAALVGLLVVSTAVMAWRFFRHAPVVLWAALITVPLVGLQGGLGALTVERELPPEIVATHLLLAMLILTFLAIVALGMQIEVQGGPGSGQRQAGLRIAHRAAAAIVLFAVVVWVGGYMGESGASTACEGWPACNGGILPGNDDQQITHMAHRYLAAALVVPLAAAVTAAWQARGALPWAAAAAGTLAAIYAAQVTVGAFNVWYTFPDALTVSHTVLASALWLTLSGVGVIGFYQPARERGREPLSAVEVPA